MDKISAIIDDIENIKSSATRYLEYLSNLSDVLTEASSYKKEFSTKLGKYSGTASVNLTGFPGLDITNADDLKAVSSDSERIAELHKIIKEMDQDIEETMDGSLQLLQNVAKKDADIRDEIRELQRDLDKAMTSASGPMGLY